MPLERLTAGLSYERRGQTSVAAAGSNPMLRLRRGRHHAHVDLVLLNGDRYIEVSFHPAASVRLVQEHARRGGRDPNGWTGALTSAIADDAHLWELWPGGRWAAEDLLGLLGGMTHPLLGASYEAGTERVREVPRWASASLAEPTVTACATRLFGPDRSSRNIVRALVTLLTRARIAWWQLAVAVAAAPIVRHEALAQALLAPVEEPADEPLPFRDDVRCARAGLALVGVARAERLLRDALGGPVGGPRRLVAAMRSLLEVERDLPWPPPGRLQDLEEACLRVAVLNPRPLVRPAPPAAPVAGQRRAAPPVAEPAWGIARRAPAVAGPTPPQDAPLPRSELAQSLCSIRLGGALELVAPRTTTELAGWGRLLGNCLAEFGPAVAAGATVILGVRDGGVLVAALEVREGRIVQLLGPRNRLPPEHLSDVVVRGVLAAL